MAIDPDVQPLLDALDARVTALEAVPPVDLAPINSAIAALDARVAALESDQPPVEPPAATGFTTFVAVEPSGEGSAFTGDGTRKIYVSSSTGDDANPGTEALPKKTVAAGKGLLRNGKPDWLLFKAGDVWTDEYFIGFSQAGFKGPSPETPLVVSAYGEGPRPLFRVTNVWFNQVGGDLTSDNMAFIGLEIYAYKRNPADPAYVPGEALRGVSAFRQTNPVTWMLIEDCKLHFLSTAVDIPGTQKRGTIILRRNIIVDDWVAPGGPHSQGVFIASTTKLHLEENYFDHNGWHAPEAISDDQLKFNHNIYLTDTNSELNIIRNIFTDDASGLQMRAPGLVDDNLWFEHPYGTNFNAADLLNKACEAKNNVMIDFKSSPDGLKKYRHAWWSIGHTHFHNNIIAHVIPHPEGGGGYAFVDIQHNNTIENNVIFDWVQGIAVPLGTGNVISNNEVRLVGQLDPNPYPDPSRRVANYVREIGGGSTSADFKAWHRARPRGVWDARYGAHAVNDYVRQGFGKEYV
jgi:parallel beta-helix repeat protein